MFSIIKIDNKPVCDMNLSEDSYRNFKCGIASFFANYVAGILHPFDVIKTRFQSKHPSHQVTTAKGLMTISYQNTKASITLLNRSI